MNIKKNYNLEIIRNISFLLVILIHVSNYFCRGYPEVSGGAFLFSTICNAFARVSVPCFFMISGALLLGREESICKSLQRTLRFVVVLLFWSAAYYIFNTLYMKQYYDLQGILVDPVEAHLWYMYALIPIYLMLPFFQVLMRNMSENLIRYLVMICICATIVMYLLSFSHEELYYDLPIVGDRAYMVYFFLGYVIMRYAKWIKISWKWLIMIALVAGGMIGAVTIVVTYQSGEFFERFTEYGNPLVMFYAATFFLLFVKAKGGAIPLSDRVKKWIDRVSSCSFGIYLVHIFFLDCFKHQVNWTYPSAWIWIPCLTFGLTVISFGIVLLLKKLPFHRWIV